MLYINVRIICKHHNGPSFRLPNIPPWTKERVSKVKPFTYVGLNCLGPIQVKKGNSVVKNVGMFIHLLSSPS